MLFPGGPRLPLAAMEGPRELEARSRACRITVAMGIQVRMRARRCFFATPPLTRTRLCRASPSCCQTTPRRACAKPSLSPTSAARWPSMRLCTSTSSWCALGSCCIRCRCGLGCRRSPRPRARSLRVQAVVGRQGDMQLTNEAGEVTRCVRCDTGTQRSADAPCAQPPAGHVQPHRAHLGRRNPPCVRARRGASRHGCAQVVRVCADKLWGFPASYVFDGKPPEMKGGELAKRYDACAASRRAAAR